VDCGFVNCRKTFYNLFFAKVTKLDSI